jgi:hypothetical protein
MLKLGKQKAETGGCKAESEKAEMAEANPEMLKS